jgi:hypothetical protein
MNTKPQLKTQPDPQPVDALREAQAAHDLAAQLAMRAASTHLRASITLANLIAKGRASVMGRAR